METRLVPPKKGHSPLQFSVHVRCGQTAGCIKMPLGMEVGVGPGDIALDGDPASPQKGRSPQFSVHDYCSQTAVCIKMPIGTAVGLSQTTLSQAHVDPPPSLPPKKVGGTAPDFRPMSIVAKRLNKSRCLHFSANVGLYCSQTAGWSN